MDNFTNLSFLVDCGLSMRVTGIDNRAPVKGSAQSGALRSVRIRYHGRNVQKCM